ncbi:platelet-derived growth factor receptor beta-like [Thalassophryne amazonica]|uniref:platelet-derived growth factor receptor beta-like n=1 Tax=Thalassophryne amazonica TaxID=390379 RepID=UPI0014714BD5|nr:platelet-derived growth factor receptor beta-like [Thalassophryne amazonica]
MMASIRVPGLTMLCLLSGLVLVCVEESSPLELIPSAPEVLLNPNSSFIVLCSGWSKVVWQLPQDWDMDGVVVENQGSTSVLRLNNATWRHSGKYTCEEASSDQTREINIFIPGQGPDEWFVPVGPGHVMKEGEEGTIPCVVSNPQLNVSLYRRPDRMLVTTASYDPSRGFTSPLNDTSYVCMASLGGEQRESQVYYVFSIVVPKAMEVELTATESVLRQGENLTVNCTVKDIEMVFFSWNFPRRQDFEPLTEFLPGRIRSFIKISPATLADSGVYECAVQETVQEQTEKKNITVRVLERGYIHLHHLAATNISSLLHQTVVLSLNIDAHPAPTIIWTKNNQTVAMETSTVTTTHLKDSRYVTSLVLVRIQMDQRGRYIVTISNDDDLKEAVFNLEVKVPPRITSLAEVSSQTVLCVGEGAPPPSISWYTCQSSHRCGNLMGGWQNLSAVSEGVALHENITEQEGRGGLAQVRSQLILHTLGSLTAVRCEARNSAGRRAWDLRLPTSSLVSQLAVLSVVLVLVVITVIFLTILIILWKKKPRYEVLWKVIESVSHDGLQYNYLDPTHLSYNSAWEVPRDNVVLGPVLGSGAFGRVVQASVSGLFHAHSVTKAAVKMLKPSSGAAQSLMSELKVLIHIGPHMNVVNLLGACTRNGPIYLITEFCCHGNLAGFLQCNKHTFQQSDCQQKSDTDGGYMDMTKEDGAQYVAMQQLSSASVQPAMYETPYAHKGDIIVNVDAACDQFQTWFVV